MPAISTHATSIDRKLHRVILDANASAFGSMMELAGAIEKEHYREFSYLREGKRRYSSAGAIQSYVSYARGLGLLDEKLDSTRPKQDVRSLESFQQWLSNAVLDYLRSKNCDITQIEGAVQALLTSNPPLLPTQERVRSRFSDPPSATFFRFSLTTLALLRPAVLQTKARKTILMPGVFEE
jgi:hypothetical protein